MLTLATFCFSMYTKFWIFFCIFNIFRAICSKSLATWLVHTCPCSFMPQHIVIHLQTWIEASSATWSYTMKLDHSSLIFLLLWRLFPLPPFVPSHYTKCPRLNGTKATVNPTVSTQATVIGLKALIWISKTPFNTWLVDPDFRNNAIKLQMKLLPTVGKPAIDMQKTELCNCLHSDKLRFCKLLTFFPRTCSFLWHWFLEPYSFLLVILNVFAYFVKWQLPGAE